MKAMWCVILMLSVAAAQSSVAEEKTVSVIPKPGKVTVGSGVFTLTAATTIVVTKATRGEGQYLAELLAPATGFTLAVKEGSEQANSIVLRSRLDNKAFGTEGYTLKVLRDRVTVDATTPVGVFYGIQTLRQLLPANLESKTKAAGVKWTLPVVAIEDVPRFSWRGLMLDTGRVYHPMDWLKQYLDLMCLHKMNRFHWHLTERVGWRIEIKKYPQLTKHYLPRDDPKNPYAGQFYTQDDIKEIVAYAKRRHIMVIPEIEMPGHSGACISAFKDKMQCVKDGPWSRRSQLLHNRIMCAGNEGTFEVLENVLSELVELFPAPWIHCGGDEPHVRVWGECKRCQARMKAEKINGPHGMYNYFMKRVEKIVLSKGKRLYGWEEIGRAGLSKSATIQSWHGIGPGVEAAKRGFDCVMSPSSHCYLDGGTPIKVCYSLEPVPAGLNPGVASHILGVEAPMWMDRWRPVQYRPLHKPRLDRQVFPRAIAIAEVGWSAQSLRNWEDFAKRLDGHKPRMKNLGISY
jgi:hexosaminidase